jgi:hypothetical protein
MRLLLILLLAAWIGVSVGCTKRESYKTRDADPTAADPGALISDDPALSGVKPAGKDGGTKPKEATEEK